MVLEIAAVGVGFIILGVSIAIFSTYKIVPPTEAHLVVTSKERFVVSPDEAVSTNKKRTYFAIPSYVPFFGRRVRVLDMTIKELVGDQETYEKNQARYLVRSSTKYRIKDVKRAAETFTDEESLKKMLEEIIEASVRAVTVNYDVVDSRSNKQLMGEKIHKELVDDLASFGLELVNFQLVDFQDTEESQIISNISKRREVEIASETRERNAEKIKQARMKEAESEEKAAEREIEKDKVILERQQQLNQAVAEREKIATEKQYEVLKVKTVKQAEITKEAAIVKANQDKETELIYKEQKRLEGEGDKLRDMERAKGEAAPIREKGFAEAEAKEKLQAALNKFGEDAIRALVAEKIVDKDKAIGIAGAEALKASDLKVFVGGPDAASGFNVGKFIAAMQVSNDGAANASLNRLGVPNDLGFAKKEFVAGLSLGEKKAKEVRPNGETTDA